MIYAKKLKNASIKSARKYKVFLCFCVFVLVTGCSSKKQADNNSLINNNRPQEQNIAREPMKIESGNLIDGTIGDLTAGSKILAVGNTNADGSVIAFQIIKGESFEDFRSMGGNMTRDRNMGTSTIERTAANAGEQRFNPEQFQDMSDEDRAKLREGMARDMGGANLTEEDRAQFMEGRANRQAANGAIASRAGIARVSGEIIDLGEGMITLKLENSGSKLIFFSDKTIVNIIK
ncbi:hypothetical protein KKC83_02465 [Patescibacteria group bacterium]|nr:hypothetical protein [Candidatus Falkowbacteria bacterium]MBU3905928.1 hypothetical protein [Patescibacteria group bacterium]MBU4015055.1 hypothetical protein [Patescibacteria group bacterium]MBU4026380.1 hypothetical protein [Patescibacteria group bacterium]MBU4072645.1 hypothetical protein [Patescibacteria group bacterium]